MNALLGRLPKNYFHVHRLTVTKLSLINQVSKLITIKTNAKADCKDYYSWIYKSISGVRSNRLRTLMQSPLIRCQYLVVLNKNLTRKIIIYRALSRDVTAARLLPDCYRDVYACRPCTRTYTSETIGVNVCFRELFRASEQSITKLV